MAYELPALPYDIDALNPTFPRRRWSTTMVSTMPPTSPT